MLVRHWIRNRLQKKSIAFALTLLTLTVASVSWTKLDKQITKAINITPLSNIAPANNETFMQAIHRLASPNRDIFLAYADTGFLDMAENFYEISLKPHGITNILFVASDRECCRHLRERFGLSCYMHRHDTQAKQHSSYGERGFIRKMNYRTEVILEAIEHGYNVLHTDTDIVYMKHPLRHINCSNKCDMAILMERGMIHNAGFLYIRPTERSIYLYKQMKNLSLIEPMMDDQSQLNIIISRMLKSNVSKFNYIRLPSSLFSSGVVYFESGNRIFANENNNSDIVVIHNNWIVSKEAKVYRFKEHLMWLVDHKGYYSNKSTQYLIYENPHLFSKLDTTVAQERQALRNAFAIGLILHRVVILPSFHCGKNEKKKTHCALNSFYRIAAFDATFGDRYREHVFLLNNKVPRSTKKSISKVYRIIGPTFGNRNNEHLNTFDDKVVIQLHPESDSGATDAEIRKWFESSPETVLRFDQLYGAFKGFNNLSEQAMFDNKILRGFVKAAYHQRP